MECVVEVAARSQVEERRGPAFMPRIRLNLRQGEDEHVFSTASFRKREERTQPCGAIPSFFVLKYMCGFWRREVGLQVQKGRETVSMR
jgi:hypothetical protein